MGGKFRVKAKAAINCKRTPVLRPNRRRSNERCVFSSEEAFQLAQNSFYLADRL
jgi:hypothetical protein